MTGLSTNEFTGDTIAEVAMVTRYYRDLSFLVFLFLACSCVGRGAFPVAMERENGLPWSGQGAKISSYYQYRFMIDCRQRKQEMICPLDGSEPAFSIRSYRGSHTLSGFGWIDIS